MRIESLSQQEVEHILLHELAHIKRRDLPVHALSVLLQVFYWFNPLLYFVRRQLQRLRELCCDATVAGILRDKTEAYSQTILQTVEWLVISPRYHGVGLIEDPTHLRVRLEWLKRKPSRHPIFRIATVFISVVAVFAFILPMAKAQSSGADNKPVAMDAFAASIAPAAAASTEQSPKTTERAAAVDETTETDASAEAETRNVVTMRGSGADREMLLKGRVFETNGQPAGEYELLVNLKQAPPGCRVLTPKIAGNRFEVWVPIGGSGWFYLELSASTKNGRKRAFQGIANWSLRQAAIDEVNLALTKANRTVEVSVTKDGAAVANAHVTAALVGNALLHRETTADGKATFHLINDAKLSQLTAWTDDFQVGGYLFRRKPRRDPLANEFTIELNDCRDQRIRFLNAEDGASIPGVQFVLTVGTGPPNYNFPGTSDTLPQPRMTTNDDGEAIYRWFPDWEKHGSYVEIIDPRWAKAESREMVEADDGALVVKLKRRQHRKALAGRVTAEGLDVGGLLVRISSFQGEEEGHVDRVYAMTNGDGRFTVDCLPGSTYCVCVMDEIYVSNTIDLIPYETDTGESNIATLQLTEGAPVEIRITSGPKRVPMRNQYINLQTPHGFKWRENGETRGGSGGKQWGVSTDHNGIAHTRALAGTELIANVYAGEWRSGEFKTTVKADGVTKIEFHRELITEREVAGRLVPPVNVDVDLAKAEIILGSIDGETDERQTVATDARGRFAFRTKAIDFGIFAYTADGKTAGIARSRDTEQPIEVQLKQTVDLHGQLLGEDDKPLVGHSVRVTPGVLGKRDTDKSFRTSFSAKKFETQTDREGNYTLKNLPSELDMTLYADPIDDSRRDAYLDEFFLRVGEDRPRMVSRLDRSRKQDDRSIAQKYASVLRDAALGDFHTMVLIFDSTARDFVDANMLDYSKTKEVGSFMHLKIRNDDSADEANAEFIKTQHWPSPKARTVFACALDSSGTELGRIELDLAAAGVEVDAVKFIRKHSPAPSDAKRAWAAAFAQAKRSNRKVWARVSQRYCGPCFRMARWLDDNRELLERDYVLLKIDNMRDEHGHEVAKRIVSNRRNFGVPFHAIFNADEELLVDSESPVGNIGYPSNYEGRRHVTKMLSDTRSDLLPEQIEQIVDTLNE